MSESTQPMPAIFLGHGSPMNALETNRYTRAWQAVGASVLRPRVILEDDRLIVRVVKVGHRRQIY